VPANFEIVANPFDPATESALPDPSTEVINLISGLLTRPYLDRVLDAEGMA
jgi:hypothetical protein